MYVITFQAWKSLIQSCKPRKIQSYIWPAIKKGLDTIAIGTAKCGKTIGYTFAICGLLATNCNVILFVYINIRTNIEYMHYLSFKYIKDCIVI